MALQDGQSISCCCVRPPGLSCTVAVKNELNKVSLYVSFVGDLALKALIQL